MIPVRKHATITLQKVMSVATIYLLPYMLPKQVVIEGPGSIKKIPQNLKESGVKKPLIVTDGVLVKLGLLDGLKKALEESGIDYAIYDGVEPNPSIENVEDAYKAYKDYCCDSLIAVGGGSAMDCAKVASLRIIKPNMTTDKMGGYFKITLTAPLKKTPYSIGVPTTAGTGAETTVAAVVSDHAKDAKYTVNDFKLGLKTVVLDPELATGLPPFATACTAMDALSHCIEGYIGGAHNKKSDEYAEKAIKMIFDNIEKATKNGKDVDARAKLCLAAHYGGICLNTSLTGYVHPFCHKLGGKYGIVHGRLIGAVLPIVLDWYGPVAYNRLARLADVIEVSAPGMSEEQKAKAFIQAIRDYDKKYGIEPHVPEIQHEHYEEIAKSIMNECTPYPSPRYMDKLDIYGLLGEIRGA